MGYWSMARTILLWYCVDMLAHCWRHQLGGIHLEEKNELRRRRRRNPQRIWEVVEEKAVITYLEELEENHCMRWSWSNKTPCRKRRLSELHSSHKWFMVLLLCSLHAGRRRLVCWGAATPSFSPKPHGRRRRHGNPRENMEDDVALRETSWKRTLCSLKTHVRYHRCICIYWWVSYVSWLVERYVLAFVDTVQYIKPWWLEYIKSIDNNINIL